MVARRSRNAAVVRRRVAWGASRRRARRLLAKRRDLSPDRAVGVPGSRGSACCHPRADPTAQRATEGRQRPAPGRSGLFEAVRRRNCRVHDRGHRADNIAGLRAKRALHPPEPVSGKRLVDSGAGWRLGRRSSADQKRTRAGFLVAAATAPRGLRASPPITRNILGPLVRRSFILWSLRSRPHVCETLSNSQQAGFIDRPYVVPERGL